MKRSAPILFLLILLSSMLGAQNFQTLIAGQHASFRGLATFGEKVVWVSGSKGTVGYSSDAGLNWKWVNPLGYDTVDFRDIVVFSAKEALIVSAGSPAVILRTNNAGTSWTPVFYDPRKEVFLDAIDFEGKNGYVLGDPIDGSFQLLKSSNKGKSWQDISNQMYLVADSGEVAFAASGSSIKLLNDILYIGTGGKYASLFAYDPKKLRVDKFDCPIWSGAASTGVFAIDFYDKETGIVVGGDFLQDQINSNNVLLTKDQGQNWIIPSSPVMGYRSDVLYITSTKIIATGTSGTDISIDGGRQWNNISKASFNSLAKSKSGKRVYLAGSDGNVVLLQME